MKPIPKWTTSRVTRGTIRAWILPALLAGYFAVFTLAGVPLARAAKADKIKAPAGSAAADPETTGDEDQSDTASPNKETPERAKLRAARGKARRDAKAAKGPSPKTSLKLLNSWGNVTTPTLDLYTAAFKVLSSKTTATFADLDGDAEFRRLSAENGLTHLGGPMLGCIAPDGAKIWLRTLRPAKVEVRVTIDGVEKVFGPVQSTPETDLTAIVPVSGLKPGTHNPYRVLVDGKPIAIPEAAAIHTTPGDSKPSSVRIAFGADYHQTGLGNQKLFDLIRSRKPAALLSYGDTAVQDRNNHLGLHRADYLLRDFFPAWKSIAASVPVYVTWDDHDYFDNDLAGIPEGFTKADQQGVRDVFQRAWNNPSYGFADDRGGIFFRTRIGPCDVIMTDDRYFRTGKEGVLLGDDQMKWLEAQLLDCKGPFIILTNGTMWSDYVSKGKDSFSVWDPKGREELYKLIEKNRIGGVLLVSGDRHGARGFTIPRPSGFKFHEFGVGSMGGKKGPPPTRPEWTEQFYGINEIYAFGEFTIDAAPSDPTVTFRLISEDGKTINETKLTRSELTPPGK